MDAMVAMSWWLLMKSGHKYPFAPPVIKFDTKTWHPNIGSHNGDLSLSFLKEEWSPAMNLTTALVTIQAILSDPELSEARDLVVAEQVSHLTRFFFPPLY
ncbi:ubiquitin-conjugating enzyme 27 [Artemisia annua]|uniref:Ubiquitin-conjugating enzyme 27 n=1 Tax=Artemisia annua TaxID=35608 RepID=A0A2U1MTJ6_ARTAN|nr:ubiquitin-conjugating enzyme 27 [Artemisia annua]